jgi:uncharacterized protein with GYD domain
MASYICLHRYTQQGIQNIKEAPDRVDDAKKAIQAAGGKIKAWYLTMGQYDLVTIVEGPDDDKAAAQLLLAIGSQGNVRTETLRAFTEDEFREIVASLP